MTEAIVVRPDAPPGARPSGWWGMILLIATEATLFALLLAAYFYLRFTADGAWPPDGLADPKIGQAAPRDARARRVGAAVRLGGVRRRAAAPGGRPARPARRDRRRHRYLVYQYVLVEQSLDRFGPRRDAYGSIFYTADRSALRARRGRRPARGVGAGPQRCGSTGPPCSPSG